MKIIIPFPLPILIHSTDEEIPLWALMILGPLIVILSGLLIYELYSIWRKWREMKE